MVEVALDGLAFTMTPEIAARLRDGALDPDVAYMRGQLKVAGDMAAFFDLLPLASNAALREALDLHTV